jgi:hypothetical protein
MAEARQNEPLPKHFPKRIPAEGRLYLEVVLEIAQELGNYLNLVHTQLNRTMPLKNYIVQKASDVATMCAKALAIKKVYEEDYMKKQLLIMCVLFDEIRPPYVEEMELWYGLHPELGYGYWYTTSFESHGNPIIGGFAPPEDSSAQVA